MKKQTLIPSWLLIATVWFALHSGGGFASGQQEVRFFVLFGWTGVLLPFIAMIILGAVNYFIWEFSRVSRSYDFRSWVERFYYPYDTIFANLMDFIFVVFLLCLPIGVSIAGGANILEEYFGTPYWLGTLIVAALAFLCSIFGSELVRRLAGIKTVALLVLLGTVIGFGMHAHWDIILEFVHNGTTSNDFAKMPVVLEKPELFSGLPPFSWLMAIKMCVLYASFQCAIAPFVSVAEPFTTRAEVVKATLFGVFLNGTALACVCFMLLGFMPAVISNNVPIPVLYVVNNLNEPFLKACYSTALFLAFISTSFTFIFSSVRRFENAQFWRKLMAEEKLPSVQKRGMLVALATILYGLSVSQFGMIAIVSKGYAYLGWVNLGLIVLPILLFGGVKIRAYMQGKGHRLVKPE